MLCDMNVEDEDMIVTGIIDCVQLGYSVSVYVFVFLSVLKAGEVWRWGESCLVRLNHVGFGQRNHFRFFIYTYFFIFFLRIVG